MYDNPQGAAFIELTCCVTRKQFVAALKAVPGVESVVDNPKSKYEQGNPGTADGREGVDHGQTGHYMQRIVLVKSQYFDRKFMFELTRHSHTDGPENQGTVSMWALLLFFTKD